MTKQSSTRRTVAAFRHHESPARFPNSSDNKLQYDLNHWHLTPIQGYKPKDAETAFLKYESLKSHITLTADTTTILTTMAGYNYVEFVAVPLPNEHQETFSDGSGVLAAVYNLDGSLLVHKRRMVFVKDSPEETALKSLKPGEGMHVLGVPRISLKLLSYRVAHHGENEQMLDWGLPYELVIVGFYGKVPASTFE